MKFNFELTRSHGTWGKAIHLPVKSFECYFFASLCCASSQHTKFLIFYFYLILHSDPIAVHAVENITRWKCWPIQQFPVHSADIQREFKAPRISDCLPLCVPLRFGHICWYHIILAVLSQALTLQPPPSASRFWPPRRFALYSHAEGFAQNSTVFRAAPPTGGLDLLAGGDWLLTLNYCFCAAIDQVWRGWMH